ncbi:MAG: SUMF1/EgtB/PvdO family nonheme iron enzyme [Magnetococcales bacterium]|nr:SUMF1/EgtB/PvdO family nonheme iron enzyme [Magnetococcales bacterium]
MSWQKFRELLGKLGSYLPQPAEQLKFKTWLQNVEQSPLFQSIKLKTARYSAKLWVQVTAGIVGFIISGLLVWSFTEVPDSEKKHRNSSTVVRRVSVVKQKPVAKKTNIKTGSSQTTAKQKPANILGYGEFKVESIPSGASVIIDGKLVGITPYLEEQMAAGLHRLFVEKRYYTPEKEAVRVEKGVVTKRSYVLKSGSGKISVLSTPAGASISIDDQPRKEKTPAILNQLKAGKHKISLAYGPCAKISTDFDLSHGQTIQLDLILEGADTSKYEGECLSQVEIFEREEKKRLIAEELKKIEDERLRQEAVARKIEEEQIKQLKIKELLDGIQEGQGAGEMNSQLWLNNLSRYQEVLTLDPGNVQARAGMAKIAEKYVLLAEVVLRKSDWTKVEEFLSMASELSPELESIKSVKSRLAEARKLEQSRSPESAPVWVEPKTGMEFVWIYPGCNFMGSDLSNSDQKPRHEVCHEGFWLGKYEVTNRQYRMFKSKHDSKSWSGYTLNGEQQPVVYVSWQDANNFAKWLSKNSSGSYRLPTEAEWEYGARAGSKNETPWGESETNICQYGNFLTPEAKTEFGWSWQAFNCEDRFKVTAPVGRFRGNKFGLFDMLGNACEWVADWYDENYYQNSPRNRPNGPLKGFFKGSRGGCWNSGPENISFAHRRNYLPSYSIDYTGFRLVREP